MLFVRNDIPAKLFLEMAGDFFLKWSHRLLVIGTITFLDSLRHELNVQWQFLNEKGLDAFSIICTEIFDKHAPKKGNIYDLSIGLSFIMKFLRQSWREVGNCKRTE